MIESPFLALMPLTKRFGETSQQERGKKLVPLASCLKNCEDTCRAGYLYVGQPPSHNPKPLAGG